jgi:hypothetical protein
MAQSRFSNSTDDEASRETGVLYAAVPQNADT